MCFHTNVMHYKTGKLEAAPDVRSVPLGEKRKKGRPKKLPNSLVKSPVRAPSEASPPEHVHLQDDEFEVDPHLEPTEEVAVELGIRPTTRKRKRVAHDVAENEAVVHQSPIDALASQILKPGLGRSKPPKKRAKNSDQEVSNPDKDDEKVLKPEAMKCKKSIGTCSHEIVFGEHFNMVAWSKYADYVRKKKSLTLIDPDYVPA